MLFIKHQYKTLNFLKCNLSKCSREVKESPYLIMVQPQLEYGAVWDPEHATNVRESELLSNLVGF